MSNDAAQNVEDRQQRAWLRSWTLWGLLCAAIVFYIDRTVLGSLFWLVLGLGVGGFPSRLFIQACKGIMNWQTRVLGPETYSQLPDDDESRLIWLTNQTMASHDPRQIPWEIFLSTIFCMSSVYGIRFGTVVGALGPLAEDGSGTALEGALWGLLWGPAVVALCLAVLVPVLLFFLCRGPSIKPIRPVMIAATDIARSLGQWRLTPGHILLALIKTPDDALARLLSQHPHDDEQVQAFVQAEVEATEARDTFSIELGHIVSESLNSAIQEAKLQRASAVRPGHLLLGLLNAWPDATRQTLEILGHQPDKLREEVASQLQLGNN